MLPFWVVCEMFYGPLPKEYLARIGDLTAPREQLMKYVVRGGLSRFVWSQWLPTAENRALHDFRVKWRQLNRDIVDFCQQNNPSSPILEMWRSVRNSDISEDQWLQTLDEALFANLDVTTGGLSWNLVYLAAYPEVQDKLRAEVEAAASSDNLAEYLQRQTTLLQSCILESSRLKPLAAFSVPQSAPTDRIVEGFVVPANMGKIVGGKKAKPKAGTEDSTPQPDSLPEKMTEVIKLEGMLENMDVDHEIAENNLMQEIGDEMGEQYGKVERLFIWRKHAGGNDDVFVKFTSPLSAVRCMKGMDGTEFADNQVVAKFWDAEKFENGEYA